MRERECVSAVFHMQFFCPLFAQQIHSFVRFVNLTVRKVDIVWLNYEGARVRYKTLKPEQFVDVNTFVGHPWIFRDADTGDKLMVQLQEVFEPIGYNINEGWPPQRRIVKISIPGRQSFLFLNTHTNPHACAREKEICHTTSTCWPVITTSSRVFHCVILV